MYLVKPGRVLWIVVDLRHKTSCSPQAVVVTTYLNVEIPHVERRALPPVL